MTFGFKAWDYANHQIVAYYTGASPVIEPKLELMATPFTLNPGGSAQWKALLAFHTGGYARGAQIYSGYSISGRVTDGSSNPVSGVAVSAGAGFSATTNASGYYTLTGLISGTYTLTPTKSGYTFLPLSRTVSVPPNATGQDFLAIPRPQGGLSVTTDISGQLWIENDFYRIELTNASSFVVKTGAGEREWQIFKPCASVEGGLGSLQILRITKEYGYGIP